MHIEIEMVDEFPAQHGQYYVLEKKGPRQRARIGDVFQGYGDYTPMIQVERVHYTKDEATKEFFFSKEPISFLFFKNQGMLKRQLQ